MRTEKSDASVGSWWVSHDIGYSLVHRQNRAVFCLHDLHQRCVVAARLPLLNDRHRVVPRPPQIIRPLDWQMFIELEFQGGDNGSKASSRANSAA